MYINIRRLSTPTSEMKQKINNLRCHAKDTLWRCIRLLIFLLLKYTCRLCHLKMIYYNCYHFIFLGGSLSWPTDVPGSTNRSTHGPVRWEHMHLVWYQYTGDDRHIAGTIASASFPHSAILCWRGRCCVGRLLRQAHLTRRVHSLLVAGSLSRYHGPLVDRVSALYI